MKRLSIAALFVLTFSIGLAGAKARSDYDRTAELWKFRNFAWLESATNEGRPSGRSPLEGFLVDDHIRSTVGHYLAAQGIYESRSDTPDVWLRYRLIAQEKTVLSGISPSTQYHLSGNSAEGSSAAYALAGYRYGRGHHSYGGHYSRHHGYGYSPYRHGYGYGHHGRRLGYGYGYYSYSPTPYEVIEATLVIEMVDARTGNVVWRGWETERLDTNPDAEDVREYLTETIDDIIDEFPPED